MNETSETWTRKSSKTVADCRVFKVREDSCGRESDNLQGSFFVIESPNWVNIIALTKTNEVLMIEQFRHGIEETILEVPGGMVDDGDADFEFAARRELVEETGFTSDEWIFLGKSRPNPAIQNNWIYHFAALNCEKTAETSFDEHESVFSKLIPLTEIKSLISDGKITHSLVVAAFYYLELNKL